jgi:phage terminase large subunit-like protein
LPFPQALYQQHPIVAGGGIFPIEKLAVLPIWDRQGIKRSVRYWDKAGTVSENAAFTTGVLMHLMQDGRFVIEHVARGRWSALEREQQIKSWQKHDQGLLSDRRRAGTGQRRQAISAASGCSPTG